MIKKFSKDSIHSMKWALHQNQSATIDLTIAEMDYGIFQPFQESLKFQLNKLDFSNRSYQVPISVQAKETIITWYKQQYQVQNIQKEEIIFCSSIGTLFSCLVEGLTKINEKILVLTPVYSYYMAAGKLLNRQVIGSELIQTRQSQSKISNYEFNIDFDDLQTKLNDSKMLVLSHPHNPSGRIWFRNQLEKIVKICKEKNVIIFSDQILADISLFNQEKREFYSILRFDYDRIIMGNSLSKSFNVSSLQSGYGIIKNQSMRKAVQKVLFNFYGDCHEPNYLSSCYYKVCLSKQGLLWLEKVNKIFTRNFKQLLKLRNEFIPKLIVTKLYSGYLAWLNFQHYADTIDKLKEKLLDQKIYVTYTASYFIPVKQTKQIRICLSVEAQIFDNFLERLKCIFGSPKPLL